MNYREESRKSMRKDFNRTHVEQKVKRVEQLPEQGAKRRISFVGGEYARHAKLLVGRLVRLIEKEEDLGNNTWKIEFVFDDDRKALNSKAGWSDLKKSYTLEGVRFK